MILAVSFFLTGYINAYDYREFIRSYSLSYEHLISAKHFLQKDEIFNESVEAEMTKWYNIISFNLTTIPNGSISNDARHGMTTETASASVGKSQGLVYFHFMNDIVLPKIKDFQQKIRNEVR